MLTSFAGCGSLKYFSACSLGQILFRAAGVDASGWLDRKSYSIGEHVNGLCRTSQLPSLVSYLLFADPALVLHESCERLQLPRLEGVARRGTVLLHVLHFNTPVLRVPGIGIMDVT